MVTSKNKSPKPQTDRKLSAAPFADKINFIRSLILGSVEPGVIKKIYLFGSYAYGKPTAKSDIDLCVVIGDEQNRADISLKIARCLYENAVIPVDLMVYREKIFFDISNPNSIENTIIEKGNLVYG